MLLDFAAAHLRVPCADCRLAEGAVLHPGGRPTLKDLYAAAQAVVSAPTATSAAPAHGRLRRPVVQETTDGIGPLGAKSMSESPLNPVAPAVADALRDATGVRFTEVPLTRDRVRLGLRDAGVPEESVHRAS